MMERLLEHWGRFVAQYPLLIILAWVILLGAGLRFAPSIDSVASAQRLSSLPTDAPSQRAARLYAEKFSAGQRAAQQGEQDVVLFTDPQGVSADDIALMQHIAAYLNDPATRPAHLVAMTAPGPQAPAAAFESDDHQALRLPVRWDTQNENALMSSVSQLDAYLARQLLPAGATLGLVGGAAINHDFFSMLFGGVGLAGLLSLLIILLVLGYVYRSPLAVVVPLSVIGVVFEIANAVIASLGQGFGLPVMNFSLEYVGFILLGAGTNYGVFLLSRYREEIARGAGWTKSDRQAALARAVGHVGEAIGSSALTVVAVTGVLGFAQLALLRVTGPAVAVAVICLLLAGLSLLPALMALCGPALFWPSNPKPGSLTTAAPTRGFWAFAGRMVTARPWLIAGAAVIVLAPLALSALSMRLSFDDLASLPSTSSASRSYTEYQRHFNDVTTVHVFVSQPGADLRTNGYRSSLDALAARLGTVPHVTGATLGDVAVDGSAVEYVVTLDVPPASQAASDAVGALYTQAHDTRFGAPLPGATTLIGGQSAYVRDEASQMATDFQLILLLAGVAIFIILALLLRSLTAPLYLIATIALSAGTAIGLTNLIYHDILGKPLFYLAPLLAFIFLVALGEDFNILTMARIREETRLLGHRNGIAAAVALTGGVVSSCGLVMAASFSRGALNPILELSESFFAITVGVLLDTFLVRPLLVPSIVMLLGHRNWVWFGRRAPTEHDRQAALEHVERA
ncbi:MAG TPA: MMPL family transporter [Ktedonobacterales bacterium]